MATRFLSKSLISLCRTQIPKLPPQPLLYVPRARPLAAFAGLIHRVSAPASFRGFATRQTTSSLNDSSPNWSNRPPKETILLDGCDFEHWLVVTEKPDETLTRDQIIDGYIKTLAQVVGSEEEARMKIYSVSTRCYFAFGALVSEELSYKLKELPNVRWVLPDSYLDVKNKDYGGEPFINGQAVPYEAKYHEEWIRNHNRANERNRRSDRPRNNDRSRNFERRRDVMQGRPPVTNQGTGGAPPNPGGPGNMGPPPNMGPGGPPNMGPGGPPNMGPGGPPNMGPPPSNMSPGMQHGNMGPPPPNYGAGAPNSAPGYQQRGGPNGGMPYQSGPGPNRPPYQNSYAPNGPGGNPGYAPNGPGGNPGYAPNGPGGNPSYAPNNYAQNGPVGNQGYAPNGPVGNQGYAPNGPGGNQGYAPNGPGNPYQTQDMPGRDVPNF